jgi:uncharacterized protein
MNNNFTTITGASEGFGKALALECASRKMNLVLVALPGSGLANLADFLEKNYGITVYSFEHDLSRKEECYRFYDEVKQLNIRVNMLINNAGIGGTHFFDEQESEFYYRQIELNVVAPTLLSHLFLEELKKNSPAYILNVSSLASFFYLPQKQVYGATKSYLRYFSTSLRHELRGKNIFVSTICPGGMNTNLRLTKQHLTQRGIGRWSIMYPDVVANIAVDKLLKNKPIIIPGFWNKIFILLDKILPGWMKNIIMERKMKQLVTSKQFESGYPELKKAS